MDLAEYAKFIAVLAFVIALIGGFAWLVKRTGMLPSGMIKRKSGGEARLKVKEVLPLDARRRLVLIQRDDVEHLLLVGSDGESVVESGITGHADTRSISETNANTGSGDET